MLLTEYGGSRLVTKSASSTGQAGGNLVVHFQQGRRVNPGTIRREAKKAGILSPLDCSLAEAIRARRTT